MYHVGWVMIFSDGRVLRGGDTETREQWLYESTFPDDSAFDRRVVWADQSPGEYVPTEFATCSATPLSEALEELPDEVSDVIRGTQRNVRFMLFA